MCGRFTREFTWQQVHDFLDLRFPSELEVLASYNVAPTQFSPVARQREGGLELIEAKWGLIPSWAKDASIGARMLNARSETAADKPSFRAAMARRRCVVPVSGFYEWQKRDEGAKQPYYIYRADGEILLFAGLWERWSKAGEPVESFTILTTSPNAMMREVHDRMPCVLEREEVERWCGGTDTDDAHAMLRPAADGVLTMHPVSSRVNNARANNDASLVVQV